MSPLQIIYAARPVVVSYSAVLSLSISQMTLRSGKKISLIAESFIPWKIRWPKIRLHGHYVSFSQHPWH